MKRIAILTALILAAVSAFGQAARVDIPLQTSGPNVPISGGPLPQALWVANAAAYLCTHPSATLVACQAAPITTYTDSTEGTTCPTATPLVQLPGNTCTAATGTTANVGFWYGGGVFDYWIVSSYGTYGPFSGNSSNSALPSSCGNPIGIPCGGTGATTAAGANLSITGVTQTGALGTSSQVSTFPGTVAAGTATPTTIGSNGVLLNGVPALQSQTSLNNYYSGGAGNLTGTGYNNNANGFEALYNNTTGYSNTVNGYAALHNNTTGYNNNANGFQAGSYIADGVTANQTSNNSVYEGFQAYPLASGDTNENVIGNTAIGHGSNTTTLGNSSITDTYLAGIVHGTSFAASTSVLGSSAASSVLTPFLMVGQNSSAFDGSIFTVRNITGASVFFDDFHDENSFTSTVTGGYSTLDCDASINGSATMNHVVCGQDRDVINTPVNTLIGYDTDMIINAPVSYFYDFHAYDWTGTGSVGTRNVILIDPFGLGHTGYGIYDQSPGDYFAGNVQFGSTVQFPSGVMTIAETYTPGITGALGPLALTSTIGNVLINPDNALTATFTPAGLTMAANTNIVLSGTGAVTFSGGGLAHAIVFPDPNAGAVYTASQVLSTFFSPMAGTVPAGGAGTYNGVAATSVCKLGTAATASTTFTFADGGTSFGTVVFAASGTTGTFTISSAKAIASGDKITLTGPATADTTAAGLNCSLVFAY